MFERYTEHARRSIFFARYEVSQFGSSEISSAELPPGILLGFGDFGAVAALRKEIEALAPKNQKVAMSVDMPLSHEFEESERLNHEWIGTRHLVVGLLRVENSVAAKLVRERGITLDQWREIARQSAPERPERTLAYLSVDFERPQPAPITPPKTSMEPTIYNLRRVADDTAERPRGHVLEQVPEDKLDLPCRIGSAEPVALAKVIDAYVEHCEDIVAQILARAD